MLVCVAISVIMDMLAFHTFLKSSSTFGMDLLPI